MNIGQQNGRIHGLILAAGMSSRMGEYKPLMALRGKPVIENTVDSVLSGGADSVTVVVGFRGQDVASVLRFRYGKQVHIVWNHAYATTDMLYSIQVGCQAMPDHDAFFLLPGDMPVVSTATFQRLLEARRESHASVIFPTLDGYRKHPPLIDSRLIPEILSFQGEGGLRALWKRHEDSIRTVPVDDAGVWVDLDTRKDYLRCREQYELSCEGVMPWRRSAVR